MGWFDSFGNETDDTAQQGKRDPLGRLPPEPEFDAFRAAWKAGSSLFGLFGEEPVKLKQPVGPEAPNRRPDVAKVETFLGRTGHLDLAKTDGPTGYYGGRVDQGIRSFQKDNALRVDGLINPDGPTLQRLGAALFDAADARERPRSQTSDLNPNPNPERERNVRAQVDRDPAASSSPSLFDFVRVAEWFDNRSINTPNRNDRIAETAPPDLAAQQPKTGSGSGQSAAPLGQSPEELSTEPAHLTPALDKIEATYRSYVNGFRRRGMPQAAANLEHFLDGSGEPRKLPRDEAIKLEPIRKAEATNIARFATKTFRGITESNDKVRELASLPEGGTLVFKDKWNRDFTLADYLWNAAFGDGDFAAAAGRAQFTSVNSQP